MTSDPAGMAGVALVRAPGPRLAEGIVTYLPRRPVDLNLARRQHDDYRAALAGSGWQLHEVEPIDECPDAVFVEDTVVVCAGLAVLTHPGAPERRAEIAGVEAAVRGAGLDVARIEAPATLDGGDVLQVGATVYVGVGGRTNSEGVAQLGRLLAPKGREVAAVPLRNVLHLKSAATALPDGSVLLHSTRRGHAGGPGVDPAVFPDVRFVAEESGVHVVPLGGQSVLVAASAPRTAALLRGIGLTPIVVDVGEFEKLEGCVTCLSVLVPT